MLDLCSIVRSRLIARTVETCLFNALTTRKKWIFYASLRMHPVLPDSTERTPRACGARGTPPALLLDLEIKKKKEREVRKGYRWRTARYGESFPALVTKSDIYAADICLADRRFSHRWIYYGPAVLKFRSTWMINENFPEKMFSSKRNQSFTWSHKLWKNCNVK